MAVGTIGEERTGFPWRALLPVLVGAGIYLVILSVGGKLLNDPDSYWHLVLGQWILDHHAVPRVDSFSFTMNGAPWVAKEWLSQILYAGAYAIAGWPGMAILATAAFALTFALLARFLADQLAPFPVMVLVAVGVMLVAPHAAARPHLLALPVMVAFVGGLVRAVDRGRAPSLLLLGLMVLWANLHAGFTLGILMVGALGLDAIVLAAREERRRVAISWVGFGLLTLLAASVTPYGPASLLSTYRVLSLGNALSVIDEWRPQDFGRIASFEICLLLGVGVALYRGFVLRPVRVLILLGLLHLALSAARNEEVIGLLLPLVLAWPLARQYPEIRAEAQDHAGRPVALAALALLAALIPATIGMAAVGHYAPNSRITPAAAIAAIKAAQVGPVFNDYDFGGYLVYAGVQSFIDGRTELYGKAFVLRHFRAVTLSDLDDFLTLLDTYKIGATLLSPATPAVAFLDRQPGWKRLYADDIAVVHVRVDAPKQ
jgi:hypothetical protein